jgi:hypothetical protein
MEMTRNIYEDKNYVKTFCDKILFNEKLEQYKKEKINAVPNLSDYIEKLDQRAIHSVKQIEDKFGLDL